MKEFEVVKNSVGQRLDLYLAIVNNDLSRTLVKKIINEGKVKVNCAIEYRPQYKLKIHDKVTIEYTNYRVKNEYSIVPEKMNLEIIYEDNDLLVINKPSGLVTHPAVGHQLGTLMNGVAAYYQQIQYVGDKKRSGLIHRLDKDTSGIILIGKSNEGLWHYSRLFAERRINKTYIVFVKGDISGKFCRNDELCISSQYGRHSVQRKKYTTRPRKKDKMAETKFRLLNLIENKGQKYSLLTAHPVTGRTHQIRVHLSELGFPVMGDVIYGSGNDYSRLMLHAWKIQVEMLGKNEIREFIAPLPQEFINIINEVK